YFDPPATDYVFIRMSGPEGRLGRLYLGKYGLWENSFQAIAPGEVKRFEVIDLRKYFREVHPLWFAPQRVLPGKYTLELRFSVPKVPERFVHSPADIREAPAELRDGQWANSATSAPATFDLLPLTKQKLVVPDWG